MNATPAAATPETETYTHTAEEIQALIDALYDASQALHVNTPQEERDRARRQADRALVRLTSKEPNGDWTPAV